MKKLHVYDNTDENFRKGALKRFKGVKDVVSVPVSSIADLHIQFTSLLNMKMVFDRAVVQTHGNWGHIFLMEKNGQKKRKEISASLLTTLFNGKNFDNLFAKNARLYFDGCKIAAGEQGWKFLEAAGRIFLQKGGECFGWTSDGYTKPGWIPFIGGHTVHHGGFVRTVIVGNGGKILGRENSSERKAKILQERRAAVSGR